MPVPFLGQAIDAIHYEPVTECWSWRDFIDYVVQSFNFIGEESIPELWSLNSEKWRILSKIKEQGLAFMSSESQISVLCVTLVWVMVKNMCLRATLFMFTFWIVGELSNLSGPQFTEL